MDNFSEKQIKNVYPTIMTIDVKKINCWQEKRNIKIHFQDHLPRQQSQKNPQKHQLQPSLKSNL